MKSKSKSMLHIDARTTVKGASKSSEGTGASKKASVPKLSAPMGKGGKRPHWDLKGRLEDMEAMFRETNSRVTDLETENKKLETDVEVKQTAVVLNSEEINSLREKIGK